MQGSEGRRLVGDKRDGDWCGGYGRSGGRRRVPLRAEALRAGAGGMAASGMTAGGDAAPLVEAGMFPEALSQGADMGPLS